MADPHDRKTHDLPRLRLALDLHNGAKGHELKTRITGLEVLDIFGWIEHELIEAVKGGLTPLNPVDNTRLTEKEWPCLYCEGGEIIDPWSEEGGGLSDYRVRSCTKRTGLMGGPLRCKDAWERWELAKRLRGMTFVTAEVQAHALAHGLPALNQTIPAANEPGHEQQASGKDCNFKTISDHVKYLLKENPSKGLAMLEIKSHWKLKKYEAAAYVLDRPMPDDEPERRRLNEQWRYHKSLLDKGE